VTISSDVAISRCRNLMGSIDSKLSSGAGLSDKEKGFINTTRLRQY
jgi:hypothetical protein